MGVTDSVGVGVETVVGLEAEESAEAVVSEGSVVPEAPAGVVCPVVVVGDDVLFCEVDAPQELITRAKDAKVRIHAVIFFICNLHNAFKRSLLVSQYCCLCQQKLLPEVSVPSAEIIQPDRIEIIPEPFRFVNNHCSLY